MMMRTYWQASRAPRYSVLFALPLLIIYQILAALAPVGPGGMSVRNGADVILQSVFLWLAGAWGPRLFMLCLIGVGAWLIARDVRTHPGKLTPSVLGGPHLLRIPLYRPVWRSPGGLLLRFPHDCRGVLQRPLPAARIWHNRLDPRALRRIPVAPLKRRSLC